MKKVGLRTRPGNHLPGELQLSIARRHRDAAVEFVRTVKSEMFELAMKNFGV